MKEVNKLNKIYMILAAFVVFALLFIPENILDLYFVVFISYTAIALKTSGNKMKNYILKALWVAMAITFALLFTNGYNGKYFTEFILMTIFLMGMELAKLYYFKNEITKGNILTKVLISISAPVAIFFIMHIVIEQIYYITTLFCLLYILSIWMVSVGSMNFIARLVLVIVQIPICFYLNQFTLDLDISQKVCLVFAIIFILLMKNKTLKSSNPM
jgi:hypothetical protein